MHLVCVDGIGEQRVAAGLLRVIITCLLARGPLRVQMVLVWPRVEQQILGRETESDFKPWLF